MTEVQDASRLNVSVESLCQALESLRARYVELFDAMANRRDAIRNADASAMKECLARERELLRDIEGLDRERGQRTLPVLRILGLRADASLDDVVDCLEGEDRLALQQERAALREVVERVQQSSTVLRMVSESLLTHVTSLVQRMHLLCSQAAVYGRDGRVGAKRPVVSGLDCRT